MYGGFPVKLRTHVGQEIHPKDFQTVEQLRDAVVKVRCTERLLCYFKHSFLQAIEQIYANPSNFKVSECLFFTDRIKQGSQFGVILLYS